MFLTAGYIHFIAFWLLPLRTFPQPFSCSISAVQTFSSAVQLFDLICSKLFRSRWSIRLHPFKNFSQPFIRSKIFRTRSSSPIQKFSAAVQPFDIIHSQVVSRSAVQFNCFERFLDLFLIHSLAVRSTVWTDTVRNVFAWDVTYGSSLLDR